MHLGEKGKKKEIRNITFGWFGETIRVGAANDLAFIDFMDKATQIDSKDEKESLKALMKLLRSQIHKNDWEIFWELALENEQDLEDIMELSKAIIEVKSRFPTGLQDDSSNGQESIDTKSKALELLKGRPDLQTAVMHNPN